MTSSDFSPVIATSERFFHLASLTDSWFDLPTWKATIWHIDQADPAFFPYLAEMLQVDQTEAWQQADSDETRKAVLEAAHERQRTRGTTAGLVAAAAEAGGEVRRIWAPPTKFFLSGNADIAERNQWLARQPEMRLYPRRIPGTQEGSVSGDCIGRLYPRTTSALVRSRLRATLVRDGIETELETADWQLASEEKQAVNLVVIPSKRGRASFLGQPMPFVAGTDASLRRIELKNVVNYTETTARLSLRTITPGLEPLDADGELVAEVRPAPPGVSFLGRPPRHTAALQSELAMYRRIRLHDPSVPAVRARAASHLGFSRLGMPPHCAEVQIAFFGKRSRVIGRYCGRPVAASDQAPRQKLLANLRLAVRESDQIRVSNQVFHPVKAGQVKAGQVKAGGFTQK